MARPKHRPRSAASIITATLALALLTGCVRTLILEEVRPLGPSHHYPELSGVVQHLEITGDGPPIILLHGFGGSTYSWRKIVPALAKDYKVVNVDLVGFGYTDRPEASGPYRRDAQIARMADLLDALDERDAHIIGHSYGGGLAIAFAARYPDRVRSLALIDSVGPNYAAERRNRAAQTTPLAYAYVRGLGLRRQFVGRVLKKSYYDATLVTPEVIDTYRHRLRIEGAVRAFRYLSSGPDLGDEQRIELAEVQAPTLVIWGENDPLMPVSVGEVGVAEIPNAEPLVVIAKAGHSPMEEQPEQVLEPLRRFLGQFTTQTRRQP